MKYWYPKTKEDKQLRNKIELVAISCYSVGLILTCLTRCPIFMLTVVLTYPISFKLFKK